MHNFHLRYNNGLRMHKSRTLSLDSQTPTSFATQIQHLFRRIKMLWTLIRNHGIWVGREILGIKNDGCNYYGEDVCRLCNMGAESFLIMIKKLKNSLTLSCLKKHNMRSSLKTRLQETRFWKTFGIFLRATFRPSRGSVTDLEVKTHIMHCCSSTTGFLRQE